jgi:hypothetical protein
MSIFKTPAPPKATPSGPAVGSMTDRQYPANNRPPGNVKHVPGAGGKSK